MAVDAKGNSHDSPERAGVLQRKLQTIEVPEGPANVCFGGIYKTFITARTSLYQVRLVHAGAVSLREKQ